MKLLFLSGEEVGMSASMAVVGFDAEDPLTILPRTPTREYKKQEIIYHPQDRNDALYLILEGRVKVSRFVETGREVILNFYRADDFIGASCFLGGNHHAEQATAVDKTTVMSWSTQELNRLVLRNPALGPALLRSLAQKLAETRHRIESFSVDHIDRRLVKTLLDFGQRFGQQRPDGMTHLLPFTHEQLARYVGTSREIVTGYMNRLRREHLVNYSRRGMDLNLRALETYLTQEASKIPPRRE
jgi:CRP-like cAMP-binding protein